MLIDAFTLHSQTPPSRQIVFPLLHLPIALFLSHPTRLSIVLFSSQMLLISSLFPLLSGENAEKNVGTSKTSSI